MNPMICRIDQMAEAGAGLAEIEAELLGSSTLDEDQTSALWLYAWIRTEQQPNVGDHGKVIPLRSRPATRPTTGSPPQHTARGSLGAVPRALFAASSALFTQFIA